MRKTWWAVAFTAEVLAVLALPAGSVAGLPSRLSVQSCRGGDGADGD
jgi:hypothetical protein